MDIDKVDGRFYTGDRRPLKEALVTFEEWQEVWKMYNDLAKARNLLRTAVDRTSVCVQEIVNLHKELEAQKIALEAKTDRRHNAE